jgi:LuxR family transcriptional regulator, maltose regulon positive regulatory protein
VIDAIRYTQAAGDWHDAARLLADHSFSLTLDGQARTIQVLLRAFPPGAGADPELALVRAGNDLGRGRLDEAAAHLAIAETYAKVRGPLTEHAGTLGVISPSHCSSSPHGAGEGVSSARGLFRSW